MSNRNDDALQGPPAEIGEKSVEARGDKATAYDLLLAKNARLREALRELHALVTGECPALLDEDRDGLGRLDVEIRNLLESEAS